MEHIADDVWYEIFLHLPMDAIIKTRCVSKVWCSILSSPNFINKWYERLNTLSDLPWLLVNPPISVKRKEFTIGYPDSHSQFISHYQSGFSFSFLSSTFPDSNEEERPAQLCPLGSSNGLVLCYALDALYVCNPLTQKWVSLPPPPTMLNIIPLTGFMCHDKCSSSSLGSASFKVVNLPRVAAARKEFKVQVFCSDLGEWKIYDVLCPQHVTWEYSVYDNLVYSLDDNLVTHNGVFYWFRKKSGNILAVSVNENTNQGTRGCECRLINLPDQAMENDLKSYLGESEGLICYAAIKVREKSLSVWVLKEEDWCLLYKDNNFHDMSTEMETLLFGDIGKIDPIKRIQILGFNPVDKNVVILSCGKYIWAYNTRTRGYQPLSQHSFQPTRVYVLNKVSTLTFALKPRLTVLPRISGGDTSFLDDQTRS